MYGPKIPQGCLFLPLLQQNVLHGFASTMVEALSQAQAGAVPFMKIPSALRSAERAAGLPTISSVPAMAGF